MASAINSDIVTTGSLVKWVGNIPTLCVYLGRDPMTDMDLIWCPIEGLITTAWINDPCWTIVWSNQPTPA